MSITQCWTVTQHIARRLLHPARHLRRHGVGHAAARSVGGHAVPKPPATVVRLVCRKLPEVLGPASKAALIGAAATTLPPSTAMPPAPAPIVPIRLAPAPSANTAPVVPVDSIILPLPVPICSSSTPLPDCSFVGPGPIPERPLSPPGVDVLEPSSFAILAAGLLGLWCVFRRDRGSERLQV
ncbi:MAG TPA: hypothetical protein VJ779_20385 [Acetobacteraceae bacterium]|nr:hypothetical protein [Acetobacteraceae bacterium]